MLIFTLHKSIASIDSDSTKTALLDEVRASKSSAPNPSTKWQVWLAWVWPICLFLVLTLLMTFPLVTNLSHQIVLGLGVDHAQNIWNLWWFKSALTSHHINPFYTDMLYFPYRQASNPLPLFLQALQPLNILLGLPVMLFDSSPTAPILTYNLLMLLNFMLCGCAMFWLVRYLTNSRLAGVVAGIVFAFSPFEQHHLQSGQLDMVSTGWLPLYLLFLHKLLYSPLTVNKNLKIRYTLLAITFFAAASYISWYFALYLLIVTPLILTVRIIEQPKRWRELSVSALLVLVGWLVVVGPLLLPTILASQDPSFTPNSGLDYQVMYSVSPSTLIGAIKDSRVLPPVWKYDTLSYASLVLGLVGIFIAKGKSRIWVVLGLVGVVLAMGPYLKLNENDALVSQTTGIMLPYAWLNNLPVLSIARVPGRFIILTDLALAVLAGYTIRYLMAKFRTLIVVLGKTTLSITAWKLKGYRAAVGVLLLAGVLGSTLELATLPQPEQTLQISPFFSELATEPDNFGILELPVTRHYIDDYLRMLNQTIHHKPIFGSYLSRPVADYYNADSSPFTQFLNLAPPTTKPDIVPPLDPFQLLSYYNIKYIVAYKYDPMNRYDRPEAYEQVAKYLQQLYGQKIAEYQVYSDNQLAAYLVPSQTQLATKENQSALVWLGKTGWYSPETDANNNVWRWSIGQASLYFDTKQTTHVSLSFSSAILVGSSAHLTLKLDGKVVDELDLQTAIKSFSISNLRLTPGQHQLVFTSDNKPISPKQLGLSKADNRLLAFVIKNLKYSFSFEN